MKFSRQTLLGASVFLGGGILLFAILQQILTTESTPNTKTTVQNVELVPVKPNPSVVSTLPPEEIPVEVPENTLQEDIQAELNKTLEQQQQRAENATQQDLQTQRYWTQQETAEILAENQRFVDNKTTSNPEITQPIVMPRSETVNTPKPKVISKPKTTEPMQQEKAKIEKKSVSNRPTNYQVQAGDGLLSLSRKYNVPVSILAMVNGLDNEDILYVGQTLNIPSVRQVKKIENEILKRQNRTMAEKSTAAQSTNPKFEQAKQQLKEARKKVKEIDAKGTFGVQIALANDQQSADKVVKQLKSAGYQVRTTETTKGIRIVVGPEKGKVAALALRKKINQDPRLNVEEAWVLHW